LLYPTIPLSIGNKQFLTGVERGSLMVGCWVLDFFVGGFRMAKLITERVRDFRKNQTPSENMLWQMLRNRKLNGYKFCRQHPLKVMYGETVRYYIADFYCHEKKLVIEIDGKIHDHQKEYDEYRTYIINRLRIRVWRLKNEELDDIMGVIAKLKSIIEQ
jgi:very-short-patch-repair endonuclease